jgi:hypothetical protein
MSYPTKPAKFRKLGKGAKQGQRGYYRREASFKPIRFVRPGISAVPPFEINVSRGLARVLVESYAFGSVIVGTIRPIHCIFQSGNGTSCLLGEGANGGVLLHKERVGSRLD